VQIDKLAFAGVIHNDLHAGNILSYTSRQGEVKSCIIDFGNFSRTTTDVSCAKMRKRQFNDLTISSEDIYKLNTVPSSSSRASVKKRCQKPLDPEDNYLDCCIIIPNTVKRISVIPGESDPTSTNIGLADWCDNNLQEDYKTRVPNRYSFKYDPVNEMNELDKRMVADGIIIRDYLLQGRDINQFIDEDNRLPELQYSYSRNGGISLLKEFITARGLGEICINMLTSPKVDPYCITLFNSEDSSAAGVGDEAVVGKMGATHTAAVSASDEPVIEKVGKIGTAYKDRIDDDDEFGDTYVEDEEEEEEDLGETKAASAPSKRELLALEERGPEDEFDGGRKKRKKTSKKRKNKVSKKRKIKAYKKRRMTCKKRGSNKKHTLKRIGK
jgi:hypothetical protein